MKLKIRGMYATALTKLFLDQGFSIVQPSPEISRRFGIELNSFPEEIFIQDRRDKQGIIVQGEAHKLDSVSKVIREELFDVIFRTGPNFLDIEFPSCAKSSLDELRNQVTTTLKGHHKFKTFAPQTVDFMEAQLLKSPKEREKMEAMLEETLILNHLEKEKFISIEHIKLEGQTINLTGGRIIEREGRKVKLKRQKEGFKPGRYNGLDIPIEEGDYALTEAEEGSWVIKHSYYSREDRLKGEFYNINTPVELYPFKIHYVDLEVDVVRWPDKDAEIIDKGDLEESLKRGHIGEELARKAIEVAEELKNSLAQ